MADKRKLDDLLLPSLPDSSSFLDVGNRVARFSRLQEDFLFLSFNSVCYLRRSDPRWYKLKKKYIYSLYIAGINLPVSVVDILR